MHTSRITVPTRSRQPLDSRPAARSLLGRAPAWTLACVTLLFTGCASEREAPAAGGASAPSEAAATANDQPAASPNPNTAATATPPAEPIRADNPANAMLELAVRAEAAGAAAAGQGPCEAALASATALTQAVPGNRPPPDRAAFLAACETLPEGARRCMEMAYAREHAEECQAASAQVTPEHRAAFAAAMGRR